MEMEDVILGDWFDGYNCRDFDAMEQIYSNDALIHGVEGLVHGGKAVVEIAKKWLEAIPDAQIIPLFTSKEEGNVIVVHWRAEGTLTGSIRDLVATGKKVAFHGLTCFRHMDNKVVEHWAAIDYRPLKSEQLQKAK